MTPTPESEIERYLRTGDSDVIFAAWSGSGFLDRVTRGDRDLRSALVRTVLRRTRRAVVPAELAAVDPTALTLAKVTPMVTGLFPARERESVLRLLATSVVFLTPSTIVDVIGKAPFPGTAWDLANLYLLSCGARTLSREAPRIVGLSAGTTCYVSMEYFRTTGPFTDFLVHEAAHVFHNCKRRTAGLPETRRREWLLPIDFSMRETFAYACEAFSRILELSRTPKERRQRLAELEADPPSFAGPEGGSYLEIVREAVEGRNGWKRILERCAPPRSTPRRRAALRTSLAEPHPESLQVAEAGVAGWGRSLPAEDEDCVVSPSDGRRLRWVEGKGWQDA